MPMETTTIPEETNSGIGGVSVGCWFLIFLLQFWRGKEVFIFEYLEYFEICTFRAEKKFPKNMHIKYSTFILYTLDFVETSQIYLPNQ